MAVLLTIALGMLLVLCLLWGWWDVNGRGKAPIAPLIALALGIWLYQLLQPSYMPKGTVQRSTTPAFQEQELEVQDRTSKPMSGEERDRIRHDRYREGLISN